MAFQIFIFYAILNFHINLSVECCGVVSFRQHFCGVVSYWYNTTSGIQGLHVTQSTFRTREIGRWRSSRGRISKRCVTQAV